MKKQLSTKTLDKLRKAIPPGGVNKISEKVGLSPSYVSKVVNGHVRNNIVIKAAIELIKESNEETTRLEQEIDSLL